MPMTPEEKKGAKILIVDDEPVARRLISSVLALHGYLTFEDAETGEAALEKLKKQQYDLVLLDKNMPGIDGIEVLRQGRIIQPFCQFIIITAYGTEDTAVEAIELGAHSYLTKPLVNVEEIAKRVEAALEESQKHTGPTSSGKPAPGSLKDTNLAEVTARITDSTSKLQELADRLKEMKRKKE